MPAVDPAMIWPGTKSAQNIRAAASAQGRRRLPERLVDSEVLLGLGEPMQPNRQAAHLDRVAGQNLRHERSEAIT